MTPFVMRRLRLTFFLLRPSLLSGSLCLLATLVLLGLASWAFVTHNALLYNGFFGPFGLVTAFQKAPASFNGFMQTLFMHHFSRTLISYFFILLITVVTYTVLEVFTKVGGDIGQTVRDAANARRSAKIPVAREVVERSVVRLVVCIMIVFYAIVLARAILPFCISLSRYGIGANHWWYIVQSAVVLVLALHLMVILMRSLALRPRLFGGVDEAVIIGMGR